MAGLCSRPAVAVHCVRTAVQRLLVLPGQVADGGMPPGTGPQRVCRRGRAALSTHATGRQQHTSTPSPKHTRRQTTNTTVPPRILAMRQHHSLGDAPQLVQHPPLVQQCPHLLQATRARSVVVGGGWGAQDRAQRLRGVGQGLGGRRHARGRWSWAARPHWPEQCLQTLHLPVACVPHVPKTRAPTARCLTPRLITLSATHPFSHHRSNRCERFRPPPTPKTKHKLAPARRARTRTPSRRPSGAAARQSHSAPTPTCRTAPWAAGQP